MLKRAILKSFNLTLRQKCIIKSHSHSFSKIGSYYSTTAARVEVEIDKVVKHEILQPQWTGANPPLQSADYEIDCGKYPIANITKNSVVSSNSKGKHIFPTELYDRVAKVYDEIGLVHLKNTNLDELKDMQFLSSEIFKESAGKEYVGGANSRSPLTGEQLDSNGNKMPLLYDTGAPGSAFIHYHHEMQYLKNPVESITFHCAKVPADPTQGKFYVSSASDVTDAFLATAPGKKLKEKGVTYYRGITDEEEFKGKPKGWDGVTEVGAINHWQRSFCTKCPKEAERLAKEMGMEVEWGEGRFMKTKYHAQGFEFWEKMKKNILMVSPADDECWYIGNWPGMEQFQPVKSFSDAKMDEVPAQLCFGDGEPWTREEVKTLIKCYDDYGMAISFHVGDVLIIDNMRFCHGRPAYTLQLGEERVLGVSLGKRFIKKGQREDKWSI